MSAIPFPNDFLDRPIDELQKFPQIGGTTVKQLKGLGFKTVGDLYEKFDKTPSFFLTKEYTSAVTRMDVLENLLEEYQKHAKSGDAAKENPAKSDVKEDVTAEIDKVTNDLNKLLKKFPRK